MNDIRYRENGHFSSPSWDHLLGNWVTTVSEIVESLWFLDGNKEWRSWILLERWDLWDNEVSESGYEAQLWRENFHKGKYFRSDTGALTVLRGDTFVCHFCVPPSTSLKLFKIAYTLARKRVRSFDQVTKKLWDVCRPLSSQTEHPFPVQIIVPSVFGKSVWNLNMVPFIILWLQLVSNSPLWSQE